MTDFFRHYLSGDRFRSIAGAAYDVGHDELAVQLLMRKPVVFVKTDFLERATGALSKRQHPCVMITGNSDLPITEKTWRMRPKTVSKWYGVNVEHSHPDLIPIPLGCENKRSPGYSGDMKVIEALTHKTIKNKRLCFLNCNPRTKPDVREPLIERFKDEPWVTYEPYGCPFERTMELTSEHKFVLCPMGNGGDTHRFAEAVYLGAIPIVQRFRVYEECAKTVPLVIVDDYSQATKEFLEQQYTELMKIKWSYDHMSFEYWRHRIVKWQ